MDAGVHLGSSAEFAGYLRIKHEGHEATIAGRHRRGTKLDMAVRLGGGKTHT
jgi:hypothetical protein